MQNAANWYYKNKIMNEMPSTQYEVTTQKKTSSESPILHNRLRRPSRLPPPMPPPPHILNLSLEKEKNSIENPDGSRKSSLSGNSYGVTPEIVQK